MMNEKNCLFFFAFVVVFVLFFYFYFLIFFFSKSTTFICVSIQSAFHPEWTLFLTSSRYLLSLELFVQEVVWVAEDALRCTLAQPQLLFQVSTFFQNEWLKPSRPLHPISKTYLTSMTGRNVFKKLLPWQVWDHELKSKHSMNKS